MSFEIDEDRLSEAQKQFICFLRCNPQLESLLACVVEQIQDIERVTVSMFTLRDCETAKGDALDKIGEIVGVPRAGRSDTIFRDTIKAQIVTNRTSGTGEEIIAAVSAFLDPGTVVELVEYYPATMAVYFPNQLTETPEPIVFTVGQNKAAGVNIYTWYFTTATPFGFLSDPTAFGFDDGDLAAVRQ